MMSQPCWRNQVQNSVPQGLVPGVSLNLKRFVCISSRIVDNWEVSVLACSRSELEFCANLC